MTARTLPPARPVRHPGPCGARRDPPCGSAVLAPYRAAEVLRNGSTACHGCGLTFRPWELPMAESGAACRAWRAS